MANSQVSGSSAFRQDVQRLGQGVDTLKADVNDLAHGAADAARSGAAELRQGAHNAVETAKDVAADATDSVRAIVTRHPLAAIGVAAGVGILVGLVLFRPRS